MKISNRVSCSSINKSTPSELLCRICLDPENSDHKLITPCKCISSMRFVHEDCLKVWLVSHSKDLSSAECEICKEKYRMKISVNSKCTCKNLSNECLSFIILPVLLCIMSAVLAVVLFFIVEGSKKNDSSTTQKIYLGIVLSASFIIESIIIIALIRAIKRGCFSVKLTYWKIESVPNEDTFVFSAEQFQSSNTMSHEEVPIMILPKSSVAFGKNIEVPEISTPKLAPVIRDGVIVGYQQRNNISCSIVNSRDVNSREFIKYDLLYGTQIVPI